MRSALHYIAGALIVGLPLLFLCGALGGTYGGSSMRDLYAIPIFMVVCFPVVGWTIIIAIIVFLFTDKGSTK